MPVKCWGWDARSRRSGTELQGVKACCRGPGLGVMLSGYDLVEHRGDGVCPGRRANCPATDFGG